MTNDTPGRDDAAGRADADESARSLDAAAPVTVEGEIVSGTDLYSFTATEVALNPRTSLALDVWFADPEAIDVPGLGGELPADRELNPLVLPCEKARWALGVLMVALFVLGMFMEAFDANGGLWFVCAAVASGALAVGADHTARRYRSQYENGLKVGSQLDRGRMRHVQANPSPPELKLALHVAQTAHNIEHSAAFTSEYLSSHRRRVNLHEEVARLSRDARDLWIERRNLVARDDIEVADASPLLSVLDAQERDLKAVWGGLVLRAEALDRYLATVRDIEPRLTYLAQLEAAADRSSRITELKIRTLEHEHAAGELDTMSAELSAVREAIDELVRGLDKDAAIIERRSLDDPTDEPMP